MGSQESIPDVYDPSTQTNERNRFRVKMINERRKENQSIVPPIDLDEGHLDSSIYAYYYDHDKGDDFCVLELFPDQYAFRKAYYSYAPDRSNSILQEEYKLRQYRWTCCGSKDRFHTNEECRQKGSNPIR